MNTLTQIENIKRQVLFNTKNNTVHELKTKLYKISLSSRKSLGIAVFGGTIMAAIAGTLLVPIFFKLIQGLREKIHGGPTAPPE